MNDAGAELPVGAGTLLQLQRSSTPLHDVPQDASGNSSQDSSGDEDTAESNDSCSLPSLHLSQLHSGESFAELLDDPSASTSEHIAPDQSLGADQQLPNSPTVAQSLSFEQTDQPLPTSPTVFDQSDPTSQQPLSLNAGYKLVFDNIDKHVKPRYMRSDSQAVSLHYVHVYGVKDRIDYSSLSSQKPTELNLYDILPSAEDYDSLKKDFTTLISRMLHTHLPFFGDDFKNLAEKHIPHQYSAEMCLKSEVVSIL